jgi:hypothetical protein
MSSYTELRIKVIELSPTGGGNRVAPKVIGPFAGVTSGAALAIQRRLHLHGLQMVILPMKI